MYEFLNINDLGRVWLKEKYEKIRSFCKTGDAINNLVFCVKLLQEQKPELYKFLIKDVTRVTHSTTSGWFFS